MHPVDWAVIFIYFVWILWDGMRRSKRTDELEGYFLANRSLPWWAVGLSVMATQLSAITLVGTTGRGYAEGMSVLQLYFGLPVAMVILSITVVPFFYRAGVYTAYEYLERRFDVKTRTLTSILFLLSRGLSCGAVLSAPSVILSIIFGWDFTLTVAAMGIPAVMYTIVGGVQAVTWADVKQMAVITFGVAAAVIVLILGLPNQLSVGDALHIAGSTGRLQAIDFSFDLSKTYTFWSGMIGGLFLMLSYFGCDQSQVQRYLTAKSVDEGRHSLLMSAFVKIPLQFVIPLIGVFMFTFYLFQPAPMLFNGVHDREVRESARGAEYAALEQKFQAAQDARRVEAERVGAARRSGDEGAIAQATAAFKTSDAEVNAVRRQAVALVRDVTPDKGFGDVNYVFPSFVTSHMPIGLVGLIIAAIFAASMSTIAAELNSLATATVIDLYKRHLVPSGTDAQYLRAAKIATGFWGVFACVVAFYAASLGPLIDVVNRFGSFFYGSILGVFVLAIGTKRATSLGAFVGLFAGMAAVGYAASYTNIAFLWHNVVGAVTVVVVGMIVSLFDPRGRRTIEATEAEAARA
jgi:solute:Na+ symporter, SSS family